MTNRAELLIPFGSRDGRMWRPNEVERGLACRCNCPACGSELVARNAGEDKQPHFAHRAASACVGAFESAVHLMAKQVLLSADRLCLPAWSGTEQMPNPPTHQDATGFWHYGRAVQRSGRIALLHGAQPEQRVGGIRPDVLARDDAGQLMIEVRVSHRVDRFKRDAVRARRYRMVEIDLSKITPADARDEATFNRLVLDAEHNRHWICFPDAEDEWQAEFDALLARANPLERLVTPVEAFALASASKGTPALMAVRPARSRTWMRCSRAR